MLGILDWGIGGLGFYARLKEFRPNADVIYLSDSGATPYGKLKRDELCRRVAQAIAFLASSGAERVVVACNAASTVVPLLRERFDFDVVSIIDHAIRMVRDAKIAEVGIVGGARTIRSGIYHRALGADGIRVQGRIAQPLSALIESGEWKGETFRKELNDILHPLKNCSALLLACTHYPAAIEQFRLLLPSAQMLDPVDHLIRHALDSWEISSSFGSSSSGIVRFLTTGDIGEMRRAGKLAFGVEVGNVEKISL